MDEATRAELRALLARAYGPAGDIDLDPAAQARLRELEDAALREADAGDGLAPVRRHHTDAPITSPAEPSGSAAQAAPSVASPRRLSPRTRLLWAASVVVAAVLTAGVTAAIVRGPAPPAGLFVHRPVPTPTLNAVVLLKPLARPVPRLISGVYTQSTATYLGYTVLLSEALPGPARGAPCITIMETADTGLLPGHGRGYGLTYRGCRAGALPAMAQFTVDRLATPELQSRYPAGTGIRFTFESDPDRVRIDIATPQRSSPTP